MARTTYTAKFKSDSVVVEVLSDEETLGAKAALYNLPPPASAPLQRNPGASYYASFAQSLKAVEDAA